MCQFVLAVITLVCVSLSVSRITTGYIAKKNSKKWLVESPTCACVVKLSNFSRFSSLKKLIFTLSTIISSLRGRAIALAVSRWFLTTEARVPVQDNPCGACYGQSGKGKDVSSSMSVFPTHVTPQTLHIAATIYVVGSKSFRPDIQKPRQMENAVRDI